MADWINKKKFRVRNKHPYWEADKAGIKFPPTPEFEDEVADAVLVEGSTPTSALRRRFLEFARAMCPEMWERLDSGPLHCSTMKPELFELKLREWLECYGLYDNWQYDWFKWHIEFCNMKKCNSAEGWFFPEGLGSKVEIQVPLELEGKSARKYVKHTVDGVLDQVFGRLQVGDSHLKWFVRFQVMGQTAALIAQQEMKHPSVINKGIAEVFHRLSLETLRKRTRKK